MGFTSSEWLFYGGIAGSGAAVLAGAAVALWLHIRKVRLRAKLEDEFGKERR